ncbi:hypothetical protein MHYP_G00061610 [Metynnis hypsauchen]
MGSQPFVEGEGKVSIVRGEPVGQVIISIMAGVRFTLAMVEMLMLSICKSLKGCPVILDKLESPSRQTGFRALKLQSTIFRFVEMCLTGRNTSGELNIALSGSIGRSGDLAGSMKERKERDPKEMTTLRRTPHAEEIPEASSKERTGVAPLPQRSKKGCFRFPKVHLLRTDSVKSQQLRLHNPFEGGSVMGKGVGPQRDYRPEEASSRRGYLLRYHLVATPRAAITYPSRSNPTSCAIGTEINGEDHLHSDDPGWHWLG